MSLLSRLRSTFAGTVRAFDAGKSSRRMRGVPTTQAAINSLMRSYGKTVVARSRYLAANNPYASAAKEAYVGALVGAGIKPSSKVGDADLKAELQQAFLRWTDEADADGLTDFYGLQSLIAAEMFEAGEVFIRRRLRRPEDGLSVPLQLQVLPCEMVPLDKNENLPGGGWIECGIEFSPFGSRVAYHFYRRHPDTDFAGQGNNFANQTVRVDASEVLHLFKPIRAGQVRGVPHTLSAIVKLAIMDAYDDAELERKRTAALFSVFVTQQAEEDNPLQPVDGDDAADSAWGLEPGAAINLRPGEGVEVASPADVGGSYELFQYRTLLAIAAGMGVPYASMTGDLRQTSYGSIRAGLVEFRRRVSAVQHQVMVFQFCRPVWAWWMDEAVLAGAVTVSPALYQADRANYLSADWKPPRWEWVDPLKDIQAEKLAVDNGFKARSDTIDEMGFDAEEVDLRIKADRDREAALNITFSATQDTRAADLSTARTAIRSGLLSRAEAARRFGFSVEELDAEIAADNARADALGLVFDTDPRKTSNAGLTQARPVGTQLPDPVGALDGAAPEDDAEEAEQ